MKGICTAISVLVIFSEVCTSLPTYIIKLLENVVLTGLYVYLSLERELLSLSRSRARAQTQASALEECLPLQGVLGGCPLFGWP